MCEGMLNQDIRWRLWHPWVWLNGKWRQKHWVDFFPYNSRGACKLVRTPCLSKREKRNKVVFMMICKCAKLYLVCQFGQKFQISKKKCVFICLYLFSTSGSYKEGVLSILTVIWMHNVEMVSGGKDIWSLVTEIWIAFCIYVV